MDNNDRRRKIFEKKLALYKEIKSLDRELARIELGIPEPYRPDANHIPDFLRSRHG